MSKLFDKNPPVKLLIALMLIVFGCVILPLLILINTGTNINSSVIIIE